MRRKLKFLRCGNSERLLADDTKGVADVVFLARGMHGLHRDKVLTEHLRSFAAALKPGGRLCVVQHRAKEEANPDESAQQGYLPQAWVIEQVKAAGFDFVAASEINANPKDTKDYEGGVWTLPPVLAEGDKDKAKYEAIGESDRMTLLFTKSAKK